MKKTIISRQILSKTAYGRTTLTQSTDEERLYFTATIYGFRNFYFGSFKFWSEEWWDFVKKVHKRIREIEELIRRDEYDFYKDEKIWDV